MNGFNGVIDKSRFCELLCPECLGISISQVVLPERAGCVWVCSWAGLNSTLVIAVIRPFAHTPPDRHLIFQVSRVIIIEVGSDFVRRKAGG